MGTPAPELPEAARRLARVAQLGGQRRVVGDRAAADGWRPPAGAHPCRGTPSLAAVSADGHTGRAGTPPVLLKACPNALQTGTRVRHHPFGVCMAPEPGHPACQFSDSKGPPRLGLCLTPPPIISRNGLSGMGRCGRAAGVGGLAWPGLASAVRPPCSGWGRRPRPSVSHSALKCLRRPERRQHYPCLRGTLAVGGERWKHF